MYLPYSIIYFIALLFLLPFQYLKRHPELRKRWLKERFGFYSELQTPNSELIIWIHAVSVGEVIAAIPLIRKIKERHPLAEIIVSTVTDTGQKVAKERIGNIAEIIYMPFDLPFVIKKAVKQIKPALFIVMETELWPNVIRILNKQGLPVLLMNGRISEKSFRGYRRLGFFIKGVLSNVSLFCMQNEIYGERIRQMGALPERIKVIGSFKFDTKPSSPPPEWTRILKCQVSSVKCQETEAGSQESGACPRAHLSGVRTREFTIIAGSTHRTEEDLIIDAYIKLTKDFPGISLIIAPRHPERFKEVEDLVRKKGLQYIKRSEISSEFGVRSSELENKDSSLVTRHSSLVVLLDVMGELASVYGAGDIAIMGGSFIRHGGQNPLEPAYWGKAIVCGSHMENFPFIEDFYKSGGALKADSGNLCLSLKELLSEQEKMSSMGRIARELYEKNAGAVDRAMEILQSLVISHQSLVKTNDQIKNSLLEKAYYIGYSLKKRHSLKYQKLLPCKVISIGNITVGGTGKTPAVIAIAEEAKRRGLFPIILTRGYRGKAKGPCLVKSSNESIVTSYEFKKNNSKDSLLVTRYSLLNKVTHHASRLYGDEPVLMAERLRDVPIVKCADRYEGGLFALNSSLVTRHSSLLFILDDGFQHWRLHRDVDIVLIDGINPFGSRKLLPAGKLREPLKELKRADIFIITKIKNEGLAGELKDINPDAPVYFSEYKISGLKDISGNELALPLMKNKRVYAFCGIANPESFRQTISSLSIQLCGFKAYRDHHRYTERDIAYLKKQAGELNCDFLITTEKDMVKIKELGMTENIYYVEVGFSVGREFFDAIFK